MQVICEMPFLNFCGMPFGDLRNPKITMNESVTHYGMVCGMIEKENQRQPYESRVKKETG